MGKIAACALLLAISLSAASLDEAGPRRDLEALSAKTRGRLGVCIQTAQVSVCVHPDDRFPMQSVMKLVVGFAVMDAVDAKRWGVNDPVTVHREDLSLYVQPLAKLVGAGGYRT